MYKFLCLLAIFTVLTCGAACADGRASFDCNRAATPSEKTVCTDDGLSALDVQLAAGYRNFIAVHSGHAADIRRDQKAWLKGRDFTCNAVKKHEDAVTCLTRSYKRQITSLSDRHLLVCGPRQDKGENFSLTCDAVNDPASLSLTLTGHQAGGDGASARALLDILIVLRQGAGPQTLRLKDAEIWKEGVQNTEQEKVVELVDVNFDGFDDIKLWTGTSAGPNNGYSYWIFDPKIGRFKPTDLGEKLSGFDISFDKGARTIKSSGRAGGGDWEGVTYRWVGDQLRTQTIETGRIYKYRIPPLEHIESVEMCADQTDRYNEKEELLSNDIGECGMERQEGDMSRAAFLALLRKNPKGYSLVIKPKGGITILYDRPVPNHSDP